jgi:hypothetical protein
VPPPGIRYPLTHSLQGSNPPVGLYSVGLSALTAFCQGERLCGTVSFSQVIAAGGRCVALPDATINDQQPEGTEKLTNPC